MQRQPILLFDWDGVIVPSNDWKWRDMWSEIFPDSPELQVRAIAILSKPEGRNLNRKALLAEILQEDDTSLAVQEALGCFSHVVITGVSMLGYFEGVHSMLQSLSAQGYSMHVITGTAQSDVDQVADNLNARKYFTSILGTQPATEKKPAIDKLDNFKQVATVVGMDSPDAFIVIGDGDSDMKLAQDIGCTFVGVANEWNGWTNETPGISMLVHDPASVADIITSSK